MVYTNHKNLEYYKRPQNITCQVACYIPHLADYNFTLVHIPDMTNKANVLSRCPDFDNGSSDNTDITILPPHLFAWAAMFSLDDHAKACQLQQKKILQQWANTFPLTKINDLFWHGDRLVVVEDLPLRRGVISLYHDPPTARHPSIANTNWAIAWDYWWPNMKHTVTEYIKGCTTCQSWKNNPTKLKPPLFPIPSESYTLPFTSIALDFITKLPHSDTYNTIVTECHCKSLTHHWWCDGLEWWSLDWLCGNPRAT